MALRPLIAICGTTGVGKSKLAIELALRLSQPSNDHGWQGARIINADSMQIYAGMDVITNKVPETERQGIDHLLMGIRQPGEQYVVGQWVQDAMRLIDETHGRNQIPIVVGGTSYWIQHLIFPNRLSSNVGEEAPQISHTSFSPNLAESVRLLPPELRDLFSSLPEEPPLATDTKSALSLHRLLAALDPTVASRWHWRDTRKVLRSLVVIRKTGRQNSELISNQAEIPLKPRYRTLCFWLYAAPAALYPRLDARVDEMVQNGLVDEIRALRDLSTSSHAMSQDESGSTAETDYTLGIYQCIGYKEFHDYLNATDPSPAAFEEAVERMKLSTRRYAKRQVSWIRNKLLPAISAANSLAHGDPVVPTFLLDATELDDKWTSNVWNPAEKIKQDFLCSHELPDPLSLSDTAHNLLSVKNKPISPTAVLSLRRKIVCPICTVNEDEPVMVDEAEQWEIHQRTRLHRRLAAKPKNGDKRQRIQHVAF